MTLTVGLTCSQCGSTFQVSLASYDAMGITSLPRRCPTCADVRQHRPQVVLARQELWADDIKVGRSAAELLRGLAEFRPRDSDKPCWRLVVKGDRYGASWSGRIDVYSHVEPVRLGAGEVVHLAHMEVRHRVWVQPWTRPTMEHGTASGYRRVPPPGAETETAPVATRSGETLGEPEEREETSQYVALLPSSSGSDPAGTLVWATARTKTTIKGLGRQYYAALEGSPLWSLRVSGGVRSGRESTDAILAVVEEGNPLIHVFREEGAETRTPITD